MSSGTIEFSSKARTLAALSGRLSAGRVLPLDLFTVCQWRDDSGAILARIAAMFGASPVAVRSSAQGEDTSRASMAGKYLTVLNVSAGAPIRAAIERVIASYGSDAGDHDILIQPMAPPARISGVAFNRDPQSGAAYRVVNYARGPDTTAVTGGADRTATFVAAPGARPPPGDLAAVFALIDELDGLFGGAPLDVEFAVGADDGALVVLQVRPLVITVQAPAASTGAAVLTAHLDRIAAKVAAAQAPHPFLCGQSTVFGVMPDWNPAEIIGVRPRPLALSLYRDLVTDGIWAYQRDNYGYRNLRSFPLVVHFAGQPFVDVRVSFNSFVPKSVVPDLAGRLVDHYIERLVAAPALHDKVEFEIVMSCAAFDLPARLVDLQSRGFSADDGAHLALSLRELTNRIINAKTGLWRIDRAKVDILAARRPQIANSTLDPLSRIYWLLEDCKRYGTLPFAGLARAGFIAMQMLRSLVAVGVLSAEDQDAVLNGVDTVSGQFVRDLNGMDRAAFLATYGHLRPGTYDVLSPRYDQAPDAYLGPQAAGRAPSSRDRPRPFAPSPAQTKEIASRIAALGLEIGVDDLFAFIRAGIELRELAKFEFTRNLSDALALFQAWGGERGFAVGDLSYADIACVRDAYAGTDDPADLIAHSIERGRARYAVTGAVWLPPLITSPDDVYGFHLPATEPNFITRRRVNAHPVVLDNGDIERDALAGAIVFIPGADPGYDWVFSCGIAGLVTAYGGVNSHMAIRAGEQGLPAVIGAGDAHYRSWSKANRLLIDCASRRVEVLS